MIIKLNGLFCQSCLWYQLRETVEVIIFVLRSLKIMFLLFFHVKGNDTESQSQALEVGWLTLYEGKWKPLLGPVSHLS